MIHLGTVNTYRLDISLNVVKQLAVSGGSLDSVGQVLPSKDGGVANEVLVGLVSTGVAVGIALLVVALVARSILGGLSFFVILQSCGDLGVLTRNQERSTTLGGGTPARREDDRQSDKKHPPGPDNAEVAPDMAVRVREG